VAFALTALIGIEGETRGKSAGVRTQTIVGTSAALILLLSKCGFGDVVSAGSVILDPSRVARKLFPASASLERESLSVAGLLWWGLRQRRQLGICSHWDGCGCRLISAVLHRDGAALHHRAWDRTVGAAADGSCARSVRVHVIYQDGRSPTSMVSAGSNCRLRDVHVWSRRSCRPRCPSSGLAAIGRSEAAQQLFSVRHDDCPDDCCADGGKVSGREPFLLPVQPPGVPVTGTAE
jgi:putative Mg2+ transporter-C (MgtC) family protein